MGQEERDPKPQGISTYWVQTCGTVPRGYCGQEESKAAGDPVTKTDVWRFGATFLKLVLCLQITYDPTMEQDRALNVLQPKGALLPRQ